MKIRIHSSENFVIPQEKEIWWVNLGQNIGVETNGKNDNFERPVAVIKVFNKHGSLVAPISSKAKEGKYFIKFYFEEGELRLMNMSQLRSLSHKRFIRKLGEIKEEDLSKIRKVLQTF